MLFPECLVASLESGLARGHPAPGPGAPNPLPPPPLNTGVLQSFQFRVGSVTTQGTGGENKQTEEN